VLIDFGALIRRRLKQIKPVYYPNQPGSGTIWQPAPLTDWVSVPPVLVAGLVRALVCVFVYELHSYKHFLYLFLHKTVSTNFSNTLTVTPRRYVGPKCSCLWAQSKRTNALAESRIIGLRTGILQEPTFPRQLACVHHFSDLPPL